MTPTNGCVVNELIEEFYIVSGSGPRTQSEPAWARTYICYAIYVKRTTIFLPDELHEELRQDAFRKRISMAEVIRLRVQKPARGGTKPSAAADPLLRAAGACRGAVMSANIDSELYGEGS